MSSDPDAGLSLMIRRSGQQRGEVTTALMTSLAALENEGGHVSKRGTEAISTLGKLCL
jgi:hypothetical protein